MDKDWWRLRGLDVVGGSDEGGESVCVWAVKEGSERDIERERERE